LLKEPLGEAETSWGLAGDAKLGPVGGDTELVPGDPAARVTVAMPPPDETRAHRALAGSSRMAVMDALRQAGAPLTVYDLAQRVGLHANTIRFHLARLVEAGLVHEAPAVRSGPGRPRLVYAVIPGEPLHHEPRGYRLLAQILASYLAASAPDGAASAILAGRQWGQFLTERPAPFRRLDARAASERLVGVFAELGFEPELADEGRRILLHRCPFREVAEQRPEIVCSVHLGLMRGALTALGAPLEATRLEPFVTPQLCVAHLEEARPAPPAATSAGRGGEHPDQGNQRDEHRTAT
jgi:predicted ArsR family transcriptional regulator